MTVVDASVLIAHLDDRDPHHERAMELLLGTADRPLESSPVTVAEVLVAPARAGRLEAGRAALRDLALREVAFGSDAAARLAVLRAETNLKLPDCCVLLAAQDAPTEEVITFDARLGQAARRLGLICGEGAKE